MVIIVGQGRAGLFADLTAAITSGHASIVAAQIYELDDGRALDMFHIQGPDGQPLTVESDLQRLKMRIEKTLQKDYTGEAPKVPAPKVSVLMRQIPASVRELVLASSRQTVIEVTAADRPGLLAQLAYVISSEGYDLRGAAISTFGEKVVDVFFLRGKTSDCLSTDEVEDLSQKLFRIAELPEV
jgi:[protein-PII] uridylyltransferase